MKKIVSLLFAALVFLFSSLPAEAQVLNGNITLNTQADVDAFDYTEVKGIIFVNSLFTGSITNLNGLSELTKCNSLLIATNPNLTSIIGLANLQTVGENLVFSRNNKLTNLDGLSSLTSVGGVTSGGLTIENNPLLADVDGLFSLTYAREVTIKDNPSLASIQGLSAFLGVGFGDLVIENNDALPHINALSSMDGVFNGNLRIIGNQVLTNIDGLRNIKQVEHDVEIRNNPALTSVGLSKLEYIVLGSLSINGNASLTSLAGLTSFDDVGTLFINNNAALTDLDGISGLSSVRGGISINGNSALTNINGLSDISGLPRSLNITNNAALTNIDGLAALTYMSGNLTIKNNDALTDLDGLAKLGFVGENIDISDNAALTDFCGLSNLFDKGEIRGTIRIVNNGANTVSITAPPDITLNNDPGLCTRDITAVVPTPATVTGCLKPAAPGRSGHNLFNIYPVGTTYITWSVTDAAGNTATAQQKIIISDNEEPAITTFPANVSVTCAADVPAVNTASVAATDNCSATVSHVSDVITNQTCVNRYTLTRTYKAEDGAGNSVSRAQIITVNDNIPPQITGLSTTKQVLAPPNHKMQDITVNYSVTDNCNAVQGYTFNVQSSEPVNGTGDGDTGPDWEIVDDHHIRLRAERAANGDGRTYTITITADDGCNAPVTSTAQVVVAHNIKSPQSGQAFKAGSTVALSGEFWDVPGNTHTAKWLIDGSTTAKATVTEPSGAKNGKVTGSYKFTSPGIYKLQMNVTDQAGVTTYANTAGDLDAIVVIYDPAGGHAYGGGYFHSPAGALQADHTATGKASYGFALNYFKNSTYPKGETQFELKVGTFEFNALNFEYMVISGATAHFKGTGKIIGGQSGISFIMSTTDGALDGSGIDKVRIKVYNKNTGQVYYDNQPGAPEGADPATPVGTHSTVVVQSNQGITAVEKGATGETLASTTASFDAHVFPNPSSGSFTLQVVSPEATDPVTVQVVDLYGRLIEVRKAVAGDILKIGARYRPGVYMVWCIQGTNYKQLKLIKGTD
jgi:hypothetical protein